MRRRDFLKNSIISAGTLAVGMPEVKAQNNTFSEISFGKELKQGTLEIEKSRISLFNKNLEIESPFFKMNIDCGGAPKAISWKNKISGSVTNLGNGDELKVNLDRSTTRIPIKGWRGNKGVKAESPENNEGLKNGFHLFEYDDSWWYHNTSPVTLWNDLDSLSDNYIYWARTHVFIPEGLENDSLSLVLGGMGLWDFRYIKVFVNGKEAGTRTWDGRWSEPGIFEIKKGSDLHAALHFGQDNVIAMQLTHQFKRTDRLNKLDPGKKKSFPSPFLKPGQFEQYLIAGTEIESVNFKVSKIEHNDTGANYNVWLHLSSDQQIEGVLKYSWTDDLSVLSKSLTITNRRANAERILQIELGNYKTDAIVSDGDQGFPVYLNDDSFYGVAHPAGWAIGKNKQVTLKQYPGTILQPESSFLSMEAVYGAGKQNNSINTFKEYLQSRMLRVRRKRNVPITIFETFGSWNKRPNEFINEDCSEAIILNLLNEVEDAKKDGVKFDYVCNEFTLDQAGDLKRFKPKLFPENYKNVREKMAKVGVRSGQWVDSTHGSWGIGKNPVIADCAVGNPEYIYSPTNYCRATDPFKSMFKTAFQYHIRENKIRLFKFDTLYAICYNTSHQHLPGIYSTEAIMNGIIETLTAIDKENNSAMILLYWGYRSPWWLLYSDTIFETGIFMEAAHPSAEPSLYARDGVSIGLDQATRWGNEVPALGKDSLGTWLSDWPWNSSIGKERWQESVIMDMCRGNLMIQLWSDEKFLTRPERKQFASFEKLFYNNPECFSNPKPILGDVWKSEPYGYSCSDGKRAFVVINNCSWQDQKFKLKLDSSWGLNDQWKYQLVRHYPEPSLLSKNGDVKFKKETYISLRPFEVTLLEVIPENEIIKYEGIQKSNIQANFKNQTKELKITVKDIVPPEDLKVPSEIPLPELPAPESVAGTSANLWVEKNYDTKKAYQLTFDTSGSGDKILAITAEMMHDGKPFVTEFRGNVGRFFNARIKSGSQMIEAKPILAEYCYMASWQGWRALLPSGTNAIDAIVVSKLPKGVDIVFKAHLIPI